MRAKAMEVFLLRIAHSKVHKSALAISMLENEQYFHTALKNLAIGIIFSVTNIDDNGNLLSEHEYSKHNPSSQSFLNRDTLPEKQYELGLVLERILDQAGLQLDSHTLGDIASNITQECWNTLVHEMNLTMGNDFPRAGLSISVTELDKSSKGDIVIYVSEGS